MSHLIEYLSAQTGVAIAIAVGVVLFGFLVYAVAVNEKMIRDRNKAVEREVGAKLDARYGHIGLRPKRSWHFPMLRIHSFHRQDEPPGSS